MSLQVKEVGREIYILGVPPIETLEEVEKYSKPYERFLITLFKLSASSSDKKVSKLLQGIFDSGEKFVVLLDYFDGILPTEKEIENEDKINKLLKEYRISLRGREEELTIAARKEAKPPESVEEVLAYLSKERPLRKTLEKNRNKIEIGGLGSRVLSKLYTILYEEYGPREVFNLPELMLEELSRLNYDSIVNNIQAYSCITTSPIVAIVGKEFTEEVKYLVGRLRK